MGIGLYNVYTLTDDIASATNELFAGTKVMTIERHESNQWDIECVETGIRIFCVDGEHLE